MLQLKHDDVCHKTARTTTRLVDGDPAETFGEGARSIDALLHPKLAAEFGRLMKTPRASELLAPSAPRT